MNKKKPLLLSENRAKYLALGGAVLTTIIWSSSFLAVKVGLETIGPLTIAGLRYVLGSLVLLPFIYLRKAPRNPISKNLWMRLILIGISSNTIANGALFWGLKYLSATTGSFLLSLVPVLVLFGGAIFLKEKPTGWQILGVIISLFGSWLFFSDGLQYGEPLGIIILSIGLLGFMSFSLLGRGIARERKLDTLRLTAIPLLIGGMLSFTLALIVEGIPRMTGTSWLVIIYLALINTALGYTVYNYSLRELTALEMNMIMNLTSLLTALQSWIFLGEKISLIQFTGMLVMIAGVIMVQRLTKSEPTLT
jgi:drug/metabolite transporter (DMT)-like permease